MYSLPQHPIGIDVLPTAADAHCCCFRHVVQEMGSVVGGYSGSGIRWLRVWMRMASPLLEHALMRRLPLTSDSHGLSGGST